KGSKRVSPFMLPASISNMASGLTAIKTGFRGPSFSPASACATSNHAIGEAYHNIAHGYSDVMLAGGAEATITPFYFVGFSNMNAMSTKNDAQEQASQPHNSNQAGLDMSEVADELPREEYEQTKS